MLLFIPNEAVYAFVHQHDRELVEVALRQKVVLCSPSTLFSVLAVIRQAVEQTQLQRTSDEILACLAAFEQQGKFADVLDKVGRSLDTVRRSWDDLAGTAAASWSASSTGVGELRPAAQAAHPRPRRRPRPCRPRRSSSPCRRRRRRAPPPGAGRVHPLGDPTPPHEATG